MITTTITSTETLTTSDSFVSIVFDADTLINLILSNYTGDMSACIVNCTNHGDCYIDPITKKLGCRCIQHYSGDACQTDTRACSSDPCLNGAECLDTTTLPSLATSNTSYWCNCSSFYYGANCESKYDLCENVTCSGHGSCSAENEVANCTCFSNYFGDQCQFEEEALKTIKQVVSAASILAIVILVLFYAIFVCNDCHAYFISRRKMKRETRKQSENIN